VRFPGDPITWAPSIQADRYSGIIGHFATS